MTATAAHPTTVGGRKPLGQRGPASGIQLHAEVRIVAEAELLQHGGERHRVLRRELRQAFSFDAAYISLFDIRQPDKFRASLMIDEGVAQWTEANDESPASPAMSQRPRVVRATRS